MVKLKVHIVFIILWVVTTPISANKNTLVLNTFLAKYIKPYVKLLKIRSDIGKRNNEITALIKEKITQLHPYLQDKEAYPGDEKLLLEGKDETTIIEFDPRLTSRAKDKNNLLDVKQIREKSKAFQTNVEKYKYLRNKIEIALKSENVTSGTRKMITSTLDEMIARMFTKECLKSNGNQQIDRPHFRAITDNWDNLWTKLKTQYTGPNNPDKQSIFLDRFQELMNIMSKDLSTLVDQYNFVCQLSDDNRKKNILKSSPDHEDDFKVEKALEIDEASVCHNFRVCSEELSSFIEKFYADLNDTVLLVIRNYAAMFLRDVNDDSYHEKERVVSLINKGAHMLEKKMKKLFKKNIEKFKLNKNHDKDANIKHLYKFVSKNIEEIKTAIHNTIPENLGSVKDNLIQNIQKDIDVNVNVDLGNLEREVGLRICPTFETCNGNYIEGRKYLGNKQVYVKVKIDMHYNKNNTRRSESKQNLTNYLSYKMIWTKTPAVSKVTRTPPILPLIQADNKSISHTTKSESEMTVTKSSSTNTRSMVIVAKPIYAEIVKENELTNAVNGSDNKEAISAGNPTSERYKSWEYKPSSYIKRSQLRRLQNYGKLLNSLQS